jgi:hypothetical protein
MWLSVGGSSVEQFWSDSRPCRRETAVGRYSPLSARSRKWTYVDLRTSRFIGFIRDPSSVRRKHRFDFTGRCAERDSGRRIHDRSIRDFSEASANLMASRKASCSRKVPTRRSSARSNSTSRRIHIV